MYRRIPSKLVAGLLRPAEHTLETTGPSALRRKNYEILQDSWFQGKVLGSCECGNELSGSIKCGKFIV
jgi:hypothetical protein